MKNPRSLWKATLLVTGPVRAERVDPINGGQTTATLLDPPSSEKNKIVLDYFFARTLLLNKSDLVELFPGKDLYVTSLIVNNGIGLHMHGTVTDVRVGSGTGNLRSFMPSVLRIFYVVVSSAYLALYQV